MSEMFLQRSFTLGSLDLFWQMNCGGQKVVTSISVFLETENVGIYKIPRHYQDTKLIDECFRELHTNTHLIEGNR